MPVKREIWTASLTENNVPYWHCPLCHGGYLKHKPGAFHSWETSESRKARDHESWDHEWIKYRFSALLLCNNESCQEPVVVAGSGRVECVQTSHDGDFDYVDFFYPEYMSPSPPLITVSRQYPQPVAAELQKAFVASWGDFSSAGNHIRSAVEYLLDYLEEPTMRLSKSGNLDRVCFRRLHDRIINLAAQHKQLIQPLLAVKWLGNAGSHPDELSREDIFDAFDILDLILQDLFLRHRDQVNKTVTAINENKGPNKVPLF